jgi:hypothetical protein
VVKEAEMIHTTSQTKKPAYNWLDAARVAWVLVVALALGLSLTHLTRIFNVNSLLCQQEPCFLPNQFLPGELAALPDQGNFVFIYLVIADFGTWLVWIGAGLLVFKRKSGELVGLVASLFLTTFMTAIMLGYIYQGAVPLKVFALSIITAVGSNSIVFLLYIFPDGNFIPRWARGPAALVLLMAVADILIYNFTPEISDHPVLGPLYTGVYFTLFALGVILQIYRYRRVSSPLQRQQTKWVLTAIAMLPLSDLLFRGVILPAIFPVATTPGTPHVIYNLITILIFRTIPFIMIPVSFVLAILRYRLWEIDILIRRTLVYGLLTAILGVLYYGGVVLIQQALRLVTGQAGQSQWVIVISTLGIAGLFNPFRSRVQNFIDRRFYRRKYDAERTMQEFAASLRNEVDLGALINHLEATVAQAMQPQKVHLWLKSSPTAVITSYLPIAGNIGEAGEGGHER